MKKTITKVVALSLIASASLYATNGDHLIALGAKARAMGGTGIAVSHGAETILSNGSMINTVEGTEITFGGFGFLPVMSSDLTLTNLIFQTASESAAKFNGIPEVSIAHKVNDNLHIGVGMFGAAGMGVDYRDTDGQLGNLGMVTSLLIFKFAFPVAYTTGGLTVSMTPVVAWGVLDMNYAIPGTGNFGSVGSGLSQTFGFAGNVGMSYDFASMGMRGLKVGAIYHSSLAMEYADNIEHATIPFGPSGAGIDGFPLGRTLEQPAEMGAGFSYTSGEHTLAFDYKFVPWSSTEGYGDFLWEDGNVFAMGYRYETDEYALRFGFNYGKSVVQNVEGGKDNAKLAAINLMNALGFPATGETHMTAGGTYVINEHFSIDLGLVYMLEKSITFDIGGLVKAPLIDDLGLVGPVLSTLNLDSKGARVTTSHQETSASGQLVFKF